MKALDQPFTKIVNGTTQFVIPVFQRDYRWTEADCERLWNDILLIAGDDSGRLHFLGSVVYTPTGDHAAAFTRWLLIDGQQRVTTLTLLLAALRDHIQEIGWKGEDGPTVTQIEAYFLKNVQEEGSRRHKLVLRRHDQETLRALLDHEELPSNRSERISENYDYFRERIAEDGVDPAFVYKGVGRLVVVDVTLSKDDDPQLIFESLNSTGIDLSQSDLIRNFILMRQPEKEQTRLYETYWSKIEVLFRGSEKTFDAYVRDYIALKSQASKQERADEIYIGFRRIYRDLEAGHGGLEALLADMLRFARYHAAFSVGGHAYPEVAESLARVRKLVDVPAPLVMKLFDCYDRVRSLSANAFNEALGNLESYVFRRAICGEQTRGYWQTFANLAYRISEQDPLGSLKVGLHRLRDSYRFPSDDDFRRELETRDIFGLRVCFFMLDRLENHDSNEPTDTSSYTIEHIMPQNEKLPPRWRKMLGDDWQAIHKAWLHRLGNLTLTGYNSKYSDHPFEEKKTMPKGFEESAVRLNKFVREQSEWTKHEMEKRGKMLAKSALAIWPPLVVDAKAVEAASEAELRELAAKRPIETVPMSDTARELFEELRLLIRALAPDVVELAESKSVSYHAPEFFLEVLPRKHRLILLLPLDFSEVEEKSGFVYDATEWKFFANARHEGGVALRVGESSDIELAMPIIRQAQLLAKS